MYTWVCCICNTYSYVCCVYIHVNHARISRTLHVHRRTPAWHANLHTESCIPSEFNTNFDLVIVDMICAPPNPRIVRVYILPLILRVVLWSTCMYMVAVKLNVGTVAVSLSFCLHFGYRFSSKTGKLAVNYCVRYKKVSVIKNWVIRRCWKISPEINFSFL